MTERYLPLTTFFVWIFFALPVGAFEWDYSYFDDVLVEVINDSSLEELKEGIPMMREMIEESRQSWQEMEVGTRCREANLKFNAFLKENVERYGAQGIDRVTYIRMRNSAAEILKWGMEKDRCEGVDPSAYVPTAVLHALYLDGQGLTEVPEEIALKVKNQDFDEIVEKLKKEDPSIFNDAGPNGDVSDDDSADLELGKKVGKAIGAAIFALFLTGILTLPELINLITSSKTGPSVQPAPSPLPSANSVEQNEETNEEKNSWARLKLDTSNVPLSDKKRAGTFRVTVVPTDEEKWQISAELMTTSSQREVELVRLDSTSSHDVTYQMRVTFPAGCKKDLVKLPVRVTATCESAEDSPLTRTVDLETFIEGLSVDLPRRQNEWELNGDTGGSITKLNLNYRRIENDKIVGDSDLLHNISLDSFTPKDAANARVAEAFKVARFSVEEEGVYDHGRFAAYKVKNARSIPGKGDAYAGTLLISGKSAQRKASVSVPTRLLTGRNNRAVRDWQTEYDNTLRIINEHVPTLKDGAAGGYQQQLRRMLERRAKTLGPEGLVELRHEIWETAQKLWEGTSAEAYEDYAAWAGAIETALDWTVYAGDIALGVLVKRFIPGSPWGQEAVKFLKGSLVTSLVAYREGKSADEWLVDEAKRLAWAIGDKLVGDLAEGAQKKLGGDANLKKIAAKWAIYVCWEFIKNLCPPNSKSVYDAAIAAGKAGSLRQTADKLEEVLLGKL